MKKQIETKLSKKVRQVSSFQQQQNQGAKFVVSGSTIRPDSTKRRARTHLSRCAEESL